MNVDRRPRVVPAGGIFTGESMSAMSDEIDFRMRRLEAEASIERLRRLEPDAAGRAIAPPPERLRRRLGHALTALGRVPDHLRPGRRSVHGHHP